MNNLLSYLKALRISANNLTIRLLVHKPLVRKKYYASVCTIIKNEGKYLREWLEYHQVVGIEHFYIYNNFSSDNYQQILQPYIDKGIVTLIEWPHTSAQCQAYTNCVEEYSPESNWIGFIDADEFAVPVNVHHIKDWLTKFEKFPCVLGFYRNFSSGGHVEEDDNKLVIEQYTSCTNIINPSMFLNTRWSSYAKPFSISHYCRFKYFNKVCPENVGLFCKLTDKASNSDFQFNHYYCKSFDYFKNKKMPNGDAWKVEMQRNFDEFYEVEHSAIYKDYAILKYVTETKLRMLKGAN